MISIGNEVGKSLEGLVGSDDNKPVVIVDMVTECRKVKHSYNKGIPARQEIDFTTNVLTIS